MSGLAIAQPLLDLFGRNPEFFVAGSYSSAQIVSFAVAITLLPPLIGISAIALATFASRRLGTFVFRLVVAALAAAFGLALARTIGVDRLVVVICSVAVVTSVVVLIVRTRGGELFICISPLRTSSSWRRSAL